MSAIINVNLSITYLAFISLFIFYKQRHCRRVFKLIDVIAIIALQTSAAIHSFHGLLLFRQSSYSQGQGDVSTRNGGSLVRIKILKIAPCKGVRIKNSCLLRSRF